MDKDKWNKRAESWEVKRKNSEESSHRIESTIEYIKEKKLISSDSVIADIGSGPCRFAAEFAKTSKRVDCFDISDKMLLYGSKHAASCDIFNINYICCDFSELDIASSKYEHAYDLVFSSLTPAVSSKEAILKMTDMSKAYCLNISHIYKLNSLEDEIKNTIFKENWVSKAFDYNFLNTFNFLFANGYNPIVDYDYRNEIKSFIPDRYYAEIIMEHILPLDMQSKENSDIIHKYLEKKANNNGYIIEETHSCYGRILWDKRLKTKRSPGMSGFYNDNKGYIL